MSAKPFRWILRISGMLGGLVLTVGITTPGYASESSVAGDWPHWRGPTRNGVAAAGPKLLEAWPAKGPKLIWKSALEIPSGREGGCGSITVSGGKAFLFAHYNAQTTKVGITTQELKNWGWMEGVPEALTKKVEASRVSFFKNFYGKTPTAEQISAHTKSFRSGLDPVLSKKYEAFITNRFHKGTLTADYSWKSLRDLSTVRDQEFASIADLGRNIKYEGYGNLFHPHNKDGGKVKSYLMKKCFGWTDKIFCFDAADGQVVWQKDFPGSAASNATYYYAASSTPTVWESKCYVVGSAGLYCLSVNDGTLVWKVKTAYSNSSPLVLNGAVYAMFEGLRAYDAKDGRLLWAQPKLKRGSRGSNSSVVPWTYQGKTYLIGVSGYNIFCAKPENGQVLWSQFFSKGSNDSTPVISENILVARGYSGLWAFTLTPEKMVRLWAAKERCGDRGSTPLVYQNHVYITGSMYGVHAACCMDIKTGELKWKQDFKKIESTSPIAVAGNIIAHIKNPKNPKTHITVLYKATPEKFEQRGLLEEPVGPFSSPVVANGRLYVRLEKSVGCYDLRAAN